MRSSVPLWRPLTKRILILTGMAAAIGVSPAHSEDRYAYPETKRIVHVDTYHGTEVEDPYRWLEDDVRQSTEVADWVARQNAVTFAYLETLPEREKIRERVTALWDYEKYSTPLKAGGRYYFQKNDGLQNQAVLYRQDSLDAEPQVLLDPNTWSTEGTVALGGLAFSDDGKYVAYGVAESGSDWYTWRVRDIVANMDLADAVRWVKFSGAAWTRDSKGFFYSRYDEPKEEEEFQGIPLNQKVYYHLAGTDQSSDTLVYERPDEPAWGFDSITTEDGNYVILSVWKGTDERNRVIYRDLGKADSEMTDLVDDFDYEYTFVGSDGPLFYFMTTLDAPKRRLVAMDITKPNAAPAEIIPERPEPMIEVSYVGGAFIASYLKDAKSHVEQFARDGTPLRAVEFPGIGSAAGFSGKQGDEETFYSFSSYTTPPSIYRFDVKTGESALLRQATVDFDPDAFLAQQIFYNSKDGTRIPMFLAHKKGIALNGKNPTLLYGYGGFNIPLTPSFNSSLVTWMEMGGVCATANLRGGGEYGEEWHEAGTKLKKQNVFDDFIAAAEWLMENKYCSPETLAIRGGSNGGLLVGAVMTQRPDLCGVCLPAVGVMDMLRFNQFTAGRFWVDDYGSPENADEFKALLAYSPYHNIREGVHYPSTMITTADTDDRVVPGHSFKFAAALQRAQAGPGKVLIRIETKAGHGAGKPTLKRIEETADQFAFALANMPHE